MLAFGWPPQLLTTPLTQSDGGRGGVFAEACRTDKKNADKFSEVVQSVGRQFESADQKKTTWPFLPSGREGKQKHADA